LPTQVGQAATLSLDGGQVLARRRAVQAAALAAAGELFYRFPHDLGADWGGVAAGKARSAAAANGFPDGADSEVAVNIPPLTGDYAGKAGFVEVTVRAFQRRAFSNVIARGSLPVAARSVAIGSPAACELGILVLNPLAKSALNAQGGGLTAVTGAPVVVNSSSDAGTVAGGGGTIRSPAFYLTGNFTTTGGGRLDGPVYLNRPPAKDPLAYLPSPDPTLLPTCSTKKCQYTSGTVELLPGRYIGGISASGSATLRLGSGLYYMDGGGFSFSGLGSLTGDGVMIDIDPGNGNADGLNVSGQGSVFLTPIKDGLYQGMTVFQNRQSAVSGSLSGSGPATNITGTFYLASALLSVTGNGGASILGSQYISDSLNIGGSGGVTVSWNANTVARRRTIVLVE
jgi:hypothetical protein